eukprot:CAMPEP_0184440784 /NCGR_PEP_ID=MMETSP0738-20130409/755751_1 /TAXON_ID=385413 /ORGANISM="Thalassiosira miniscula, Strain CCMP1093" /LENGTH=145 /DNA_ID=CAMNT_0026808697 /DNA_START=255 /DNA_END=692 /DNA_ORIENTATION=-
MAKMRFGVVQLDAVPFLVVAGYIRYSSEKGDLTKERADWVLGALGLWYAFRLLRWANVTITQICEKLDIYCFRLKTRTTTKRYIRYGSEKGDLTKERADWMLGALCLWYTFRLLRWANVTITQICEKLDIYCFRLKTRTTTKKEE